MSEVHCTAWIHCDPKDFDFVKQTLQDHGMLDETDTTDSSVGFPARCLALATVRSSAFASPEVLAIAKSCRLDCFYNNDEHAAPEFRAKLPSLSFCLNSNIERIIDKIEEFLNKLIVFNWKSYEEMDNQ